MYSRNLYRRNDGAPVPPPNYGGTAYAEKSDECGENGRGVCDIAKDEGFPSKEAFFNTETPGEQATETEENAVRDETREKDGDENGMLNVAKGLDEKRFGADDLVLAAVLLSLLGSESDDAVSLILLMTLL